MHSFPALAFCLIIYQVYSCTGTAAGTEASAGAGLAIHVIPKSHTFQIDHTHAAPNTRVRRGGGAVAAPKPVGTVPGMPSAGSGIGAQVAGSAGFGLGTTLLGKLFPNGK